MPKKNAALLQDKLLANSVLKIADCTGYATTMPTITQMVFGALSALNVTLLARVALRLPGLRFPHPQRIPELHRSCMNAAAGGVVYSTWRLSSWRRRCSSPVGVELRSMAASAHGSDQLLRAEFSRRLGVQSLQRSHSRVAALSRRVTRPGAAIADVQ